MKLTYWGKFVKDSDSFAEYELEGGCSKLIITLINVLNVLKGEVCEFSRWTRWRKVAYIKALNEYLNYNVENFDDFILTNKLVDIGCGSIKMPVNILKSLDNNCEHNMVVVGEPGEIHYLLKENKTLADCMNNNQGLVSFSMKSTGELMFMKNYINERDFIREEYHPDGGLTAELYELRWLVENNRGANKNVCAHSAFDDPECLNRYYLCEKIHVYKNDDGTYEIDTRDVDGRPVSCETRDGDSLYSVYYQYMVEKGYFKDKEKDKVKKK